jgi:NADH dehydrogenase
MGQVPSLPEIQAKLYLRNRRPGNAVFRGLESGLPHFPNFHPGKIRARQVGAFQVAADAAEVLVTGGAGVMGRRLSLALRNRGYPVRVLALPDDAHADALATFGIRVFPGDVTRPETLPPALEGVSIVYHLAALLFAPRDPALFRKVNAEGTAQLVRASEAAGVVHFIHVSSISVLYPWSNAYAASKLQSEAAVKASRLAFTIVRPSLAYEDGGAAEFMRFVEHLRRLPIVFLPRGGRALKNPVHVEDLVEGFLALPGNPRALGRTYHLTGGEAVTLREMARLLLAHMGRPKPIVGFPLWLGFLLAVAARAWSRLSGRHSAVTVQSLTGLVQDAAPRDPDAARDLGYRPRSFREGIAALRSLEGCLSR